MEDERIPVFGLDAEGNEKRGFDWLIIDGEPYIETIYKERTRVKTPARKAFEAYKQLQQNHQIR